MAVAVDEGDVSGGVAPADDRAVEAVALLALVLVGHPVIDRFPRRRGHRNPSPRKSQAGLGLLGIPVHPASLIRLAGATFMILGVVLIRT